MFVSRLPETGWFLQACQTYRPVLAQFGPEHADLPTPCSDFSALDLVSHGSASARCVVGLLRREPLEDIFSEIPVAAAGDPAEVRLTQYDERLAALHQALSEVGDQFSEDEIAVLMLGEVSWRDNLAYCAFDLFIHAWDLAQAIDVEVDIPVASLEGAWSAIEPFGGYLRDANMLGFEVTPGDTDDSIERIVAWSGRRPLRPPGERRARQGR
jgi:uncharacterized protein (TIGR03086 family)